MAIATCRACSPLQTPPTARIPGSIRACSPSTPGGLVLLTGGRNGPLSALLQESKVVEARQLLYDYLDWFGSDSVYLELQQNFLQGDAKRNRDLAALADRAGAPLVANNDVHYHVPERYRLQHALVAASHNTTIDQALRYIQPNHHLYQKPPGGIWRSCSGTIPKPSPTRGGLPVCASST